MSRRDSKRSSPTKKQIIYAHTGNGRGSTSTAVRRFSTISVDHPKVRSNDSASSGTQFFFDQTMKVRVVYFDNKASGTVSLGIHVDDADNAVPANTPGAASVGTLKAYENHENNTLHTCVHWEGVVYAGERMFAFSSTVLDSTSTITHFYVEVLEE